VSGGSVRVTAHLREQVRSTDAAVVVGSDARRREDFTSSLNVLFLV